VEAHRRTLAAVSVGGRQKLEVGRRPTWLSDEVSWPRVIDRSPSEYVAKCQFYDEGLSEEKMVPSNDNEEMWEFYDERCGHLL